MAQAGLKQRRTLKMTGFTLISLGVGLGGCAGGSAEVAAGAATLPALRVFPGSLLLPAPGSPRPHLPDTCGAAALAGLVGRPRKEIPVPVDLTRRRVACTACPVAPDVRMDRLNILYDAQTGRVTKITCG